MFSLKPNVASIAMSTSYVTVEEITYIIDNVSHSLTRSIQENYMIYKQDNLDQQIFL